MRLRREGGEFYATPTGNQGSGILCSLARADALLIGPSDAIVLKAGAQATVLVLAPGAVEAVGRTGGAPAAEELNHQRGEASEKSGADDHRGDIELRWLEEREKLDLDRIEPMVPVDDVGDPQDDDRAANELRTFDECRCSHVPSWRP